MTQAVNVTVGILVRDGKYLLCRRKPGQKYELKWEFPGGKMEPGETHEATLIRELREEINTVPLHWSFFHNDRNEYADGGVFDVLYYIVDAFEGEPQSVEFHEIAWVTAEEFDRFDILEGNRKVCRRLQSSGDSLQSGESYV